MTGSSGKQVLWGELHSPCKAAIRGGVHWGVFRRMTQIGPLCFPAYQEGPYCRAQAWPTNRCGDLVVELPLWGTKVLQGLMKGGLLLLGASKHTPQPEPDCHPSWKDTCFPPDGTSQPSHRKCRVSSCCPSLLRLRSSVWVCLHVSLSR